MHAQFYNFAFLTNTTEMAYFVHWLHLVLGKTYISDSNTGRIFSHVDFFNDITSKVPAPFQTDVIVDEQIRLGVSVDAKGEYCEYLLSSVLYL